MNRRRAWMLGACSVVAVVVLVALTRPRVDENELWEKTITAFEANRFAEAEAGLNQLETIRPPNPRDFGLRARLALAAGKDERALEALRRVPDDHPLGSWARLVTGQIEVRRNRLPDAEKALRQALKIDPGLVQARRELIYVLAMQSRRAELDEAFEALAERSDLSFRETWIWSMVPDLIWWVPEEQSELLRKYLEATPDDPPTRLALAESYRRMSRYDDALKAVEPLPADSPDARAARALLALDQGDEKTTAALLAEGPENHPGLARLRGRLAMARGDGDAAVKHFRLARQAEPDRRDSASDLGRALLLAGKPNEAAPYLDAVKKLDALASLLLRAEREAPKGPMLRELAAASVAAGRVPEALAWYRRAIALDPLDREAQQAIFRISANAQPSSAAAGFAREAPEVRRTAAEAQSTGSK